MTCSSARIDLAARRLLSSIAGTREGRVSAMALAHMRGAGKALLDAGLIAQRGSSMCSVTDDDLEDALTPIFVHPITEQTGHLGNAAWHDERASARRRVYALDMAATARRVVARLDCSLAKDPVPYLDGVVLDFGTARLPKRRARVGIWVARGLTTPAVFEDFRQLVARRPAEGLRLVISLDPAKQLCRSTMKGHEVVPLEDAVDHEDGIAANLEILSARLLTGPSEQGPVWVSGDGAVLIVHGERFDFKGTKQKAAVLMMAEAFIAGEHRLSTDAVLEAAACGRTVRRLSELFKGHPAWKRVIFESGASCWIEG
ncbi:MAG: hypothetical protein JJ869_21680 [Marivita sp.]|uniref:hypothetical protein n=1 Tax=Marivita sp. TaxID=2003365 RepID=UPI001AFFA229|nr:hypothetical protein [Marivita sp.]MBO6886163.1 hypothetical protein [Marivita sp.]